MLAIVPARGGSKGLPRKNMRSLAGRPLIGHVLATLDASAVPDRLLLSSDSAEILNWAEVHGFEALPRPAELAGDETTISELAAHVADELDWSGDIGVFQPTSPLVSADSIRKAADAFREAGVDSLASCIREEHLFWLDEAGDLSEARPLFEERVNRQASPRKVLRENGAIQLIRGEALRSGREMVTERHLLFEMDPAEGLDIDTVDDFLVARQRLTRGTVLFRVRANAMVGSGHLYHCLQIADELLDQRITFLLNDCDPFVAELLEEQGHAHRVESDMEQDLPELAGPGVSVIVNDVLDTTEEEVLMQRAAGFRVVNVEDLGPGARFADWVVNALYPIQDGVAGRVSWGPRFATLRNEFHALPDKVIAENPQRLLITFGGTDPSGLAARCAKLLRDELDVEIRVVLGPGAPDDQSFKGLSVARRVPSMAAEMMAADLILTSAGRTVYEAAATGTPVVVLAQNAREATHAHLSFDDGVVFLGLGPVVDDEQIVETVKRTLADASLRGELSARLRSSIDSLGAIRIAGRIRGMLEGL